MPQQKAFKRKLVECIKWILPRGSVWHVLLPFIPFVLPALYLAADGSANTELYRASSIVVFGIFAVWMLSDKISFRAQNSFMWEAVTIGLITVMCLSLLLSEDRLTSLIGINTDYQGLIVQLSAIAIGYYAAKFAHRLKFWRTASVITGVICIASIALDLPYILDSYRESGLVLHATGMGLYAVVCLGVNLAFLCSTKTSLHWRIWHYLTLVIVLATLVLSASRIALFAALVVAAFYLVWFIANRVLVAFVLTMLILLSVLGGKLIPASGRLTSPDRVEGGITYRLDLYKWSLQQSRPSLFGAGPSQVANVLASGGHAAPPAIQKTLDDNFAFWYSHNQFIDTYIQYGILGLLLLCTLLVIGYAKQVRNLFLPQTEQTRQLIAILFVITVVAGAHLLVNTPSLELASLVWLAVFSALHVNPLAPKKTAVRGFN